MNGRNWTAEEDDYLKRSWGSSRKTKEIANHLNRSVSAVHSRANNLKVVSGRWWTEAELDYLKSNWSSQSALEISEVLMRSISAIQLKANKMGLEGGHRRTSLAMRTGEFIRCAICGREFYKKNCLVQSRNFCSRKCLTIGLAHLQSPNKAELALDTLLQTNFPNEYLFNGDYSQGVTLGGLIPDWINANGKKQVIELFGDYWHDGKRLKVKWKATEFGRRAVYSQLGFDCLIIWGHELKSPNEVVERIREFKQGESSNEGKNR